jgi:hypothetical protein
MTGTTNNRVAAETYGGGNDGIPANRKKVYGIFQGEEERVSLSSSLWNRADWNSFVRTGCRM